MWFGYLIAIVVSAVVLVLRFWIDNYSSDSHPFILPFVIPILFASWFGGLNCGLFTIFLNGLIGYLFFIQPDRFGGIASLENQFRMGIFLLVGVLICWFQELLRRYRQRIHLAMLEIQQQRDQLEKEVAAQALLQDALQRKEHRLQLIIESSPVGVFLANQSGKIVLANLPMEKMFGYESGEMLGLFVEALVPQGIREIHPKLRQKFLENREERILGKNREICGLRKDGVEFPLELYLKTITMDDGPHALGSVVDISERKQSEQNLLQSERRYRALIKASSQIVWTVGANGESSVTDWWNELTGQSKSEAGGWGWLEALHPDDRSRARESWTQAFESQTHFNIEYRVRTQDGSYRDFAVYAVALLDSEGRKEEWVGTLTDVTEKKQQERALRENEQQLRLLLEGVPQLVWTCLTDGRCDYVSPQWVKYTGRPETEQLGYGWLEAVHPDDRPQLLQKWEVAVSSGNPFDVEFRIRSATHGYRWFKTRAVLFTPTDGPAKWFGTNTDIHDKKLIEQQLIELNNTLENRVQDRTEELEKQAIELAQSRNDLQRQTLLLESILNSMGEALVVADPHGKIFLLNQAAEKLHDRGPTKDSYENWNSIYGLFQLDGKTPFPPEELPLIRAVRGEATDDIEMIIKSPTLSESRFISVSGRPMETETGESQGGLVVLRDITSRYQAEIALRESEDRFRGAFEYAAIGMAIVSLEGRWLRVNRALCNIVGYSQEELLATDFQTITHPEDLKSDLDLAHQLLSGAIPYYHLEKRYIHKQGHIVEILLTGSLVRNSQGEPLYFVAQIEDISERKRSENRLKQSLQEKEILLKEIHHRVKNNLQIVSTLLYLQADYTTDENTIAMFQESQGRVKSMALIHERLYRTGDLARIDFSDYIRQLAEDLYHSYKVSIDDIVLDVDVDVPPISIDVAIPCGLVINELMTNCLKHAFCNPPKGWIKVAFHQLDGQNVLSIADNGCGLPPHFDFSKANSFGLKLVKTLSRQLEGDLKVDSNQGTVFTIRFPRTRA